MVATVMTAQRISFCNKQEFFWLNPLSFIWFFNSLSQIYRLLSLANHQAC
jgi:hypothetical protein